MNDSVIQKPWFRSLVSALAGFVAYGAWAFYANMEHGTHEGVKSALVQGGFSFTITLIINVLIEVLYKRFKDVSAGQWITAVIACITLYCASYGVNYIAGTMNIIKTILPGAVMSTFYIVGYVKTVHHLAKNSAQ